MVLGSMEGHMRMQHGQVAEVRRGWAVLPPGKEPRTYRMAFPTAEGPQSCLVEGFPGQKVTRTEMRAHFIHRYIWDTVVILEEGNLSHARCPRCDMLVPWRALNGRNLSTTHCTRGAERKIRRLAEEELREIS